MQDLSVLVAHVDSGVLIDSSDPDYALLAAATRAIQTILDKVLNREIGRSTATQQDETPAIVPIDAGEEWFPWSAGENWDFEVDFWTTLVEHPVLAASDTTALLQG